MASHSIKVRLIIKSDMIYFLQLIIGSEASNLSSSALQEESTESSTL